MTVRVRAGSRLHFGFQNLSLAHERLYGGVGVALSEPAVVLEAEAAPEVVCEDDTVADYAERAVDLLGVDGVAITVEERLPRHVGLGSGTQIALATLTAVAQVHDRAARVRKRAPALGRGGRSGVGVASFRQGGFVVDGGHPTEQFTTAAPAPGEWTVPPVVARHELPPSWRFVLVSPEAPSGRSDAEEDASMRHVVEHADPGIADEVARLLVRRLLPAAATGDAATFGDAVADLGRLNGAWYADVQGGVYRPPAGDLIDALNEEPAVHAAGQSSWGPTVFALATAGDAERVAATAQEALGATGLDGAVTVARPRAAGADVTAVDDRSDPSTTPRAGEDG
jgi:beta-ribofuranosylaminobenzene 5'-phosphate synthase